MIRLVSTRDTKKLGHSYIDVLMQGLAPDGGLYTPEEFPQFSLADIENMRLMSYANIAYMTKSILCGDSIPPETLQTMINETYTPEIFQSPLHDIVPIDRIGDQLYKVNVSCGPTASFKDIAMQLLGREMEYALSMSGDALPILGATSGDTGSAAEAALRGKKGIALCMLSPLEGMSDFQRAQMGALSGENIVNVSVRGCFDDCQDLVKTLKKQPEFARLGAVNSINFARISSQVAYYVYLYTRIATTTGDPIDVAVPSGNFGNMLAAYIARSMGIPFRRLIVATNENNVLDRLIRTGIYEQQRSNITSSPSMDISKASNYERLAYYLLNRDPEATTRYMHIFDTTGRVDFHDFGIDTSVFTTQGFESGHSTHQERLQTIRETYEQSTFVIDPHTADAVTVAKRFLDPSEKVPMVCIETALAVKFESTIQEALGFVPKRSERWEHVEQGFREDQFVTIDPTVEALVPIMRSLIATL